jgi:PLP dependent protein
MTSLEDNLKQVQRKIAEAAERSGRRPSDVSLVAVSKTKPLAMIREAFAAGQKIFGENYVQEAVEKVREFPQAEWHMIGSLQTNKVKLIAGHFSLIHSVDREKLAHEINKVSAAKSVIQDILLQIHLGDEESKHGFEMTEAPRVLANIQECKNLRLRGLMALPPLTGDEKISRKFFADLKTAFEKWRAKEIAEENRVHFNQLSMGTSSDYEWAILEGATMVRVGTAIFGERV